MFSRNKVCNTYILIQNKQLVDRVMCYKNQMEQKGNELNKNISEEIL